MAEEWREIEGYEGFYEVSNLGRVRSVDHVTTNRKGINRRFKGQIIKLKKMKRTGYVEVCLCKNGVLSTKLVHRLVAKAFIESDPARQYVDHINGDKTDNRASNIRYVTQAENCQAAYKIGLIDRDKVSKLSRERFLKLGLHKTNCKPVIRDDGKRYESIAEAARALNGHPNGVGRVVRGERQTYKGHKFAFATGN